MREKCKVGRDMIRQKFGTGSGADVLEDAQDAEFDEEELEDEEIRRLKLPSWWDEARYLRPCLAVRAAYDTLGNVSDLHICTHLLMIITLLLVSLFYFSEYLYCRIA